MIQIIKRSILHELKRIQRLINFLQSDNLQQSGYIEKLKRRKHTYYYLCITKNKKKKRLYLGKANSPELKRAVSVFFKKAHLEILKHNKEVLEEAINNLWDDSVSGIIGHLPRVCREVCREGFRDPRLEELKAWASADYPKNTYPLSESANYAKDGTRVRSKGEALWYNLLLEAGIPFRYECKITVVDENGWEVELCPDFMIQCYDGTMIIIEHLGGLKSAKYRSDLTAKLYYYQKEGYVIGDNLFLTSDDADHNTSSEMIARKVQEIEKMFYRAA